MLEINVFELFQPRTPSTGASSNHSFYDSHECGNESAWKWAASVVDLSPAPLGLDETDGSEHLEMP